PAPLFPYTTLFRSDQHQDRASSRAHLVALLAREPVRPQPQRRDLLLVEPLRHYLTQPMPLAAIVKPDGANPRNLRVYMLQTMNDGRPVTQSAAPLNGVGTRRGRMSSAARTSSPPKFTMRRLGS